MRDRADADPPRHPDVANSIASSRNRWMLKAVVSSGATAWVLDPWRGSLVEAVDAEAEQLSAAGAGCRLGLAGAETLGSN